MKKTVQHKTVKLKFKFNFKVEKVYKAFSSIEARKKWSVPKGDAIKYLKSDFTVGGVDRFKCGSPQAMEFGGVVHYEDIVKNKRIVSTETITYKSKRISSALVTTEFIEADAFTLLILTAQVASYDGMDMSKGYKQGWKSVLSNLNEYLKI
jgi:uncharacterized protein YndB with AHSA1/START domain